MLALHFGGAFPFSEIMSKTRRELDLYVRIYERQAAEQQITDEYLYPADGKKRQLPDAKKMRSLVDERIKSWH